MLLDNFDPRESKIRNTELEIEDRWILSTTDSMVEDVTANLEKNEYHQALSILNKFIVDDFSRWYIKIIRDRLWLEDSSNEMNPSKHAAYMTLAKVFDKVSRILAPLAPFMSEEIHLNLLQKDLSSIHMAEWPRPERIDKKLEQEMDIVRKIFEAGSSCRQNAGIKLRYPIANVTVVGGDAVKSACTQLGEVIKKQLNTKELSYAEEAKDLSYSATPDFKVLGPKYGKDAVKAADLIRKNAVNLKNIKSSGKTITVGGFEITPDMVSEIKVQVPEKYSASEFTSNEASGIVYIDSKMDESLLREALAREIIRNVQELRKQNNLEELQRIRIQVMDCPEVRDMLSEFRILVMNEARADEIQMRPALESKTSFVFQEKKVTFSISF
ncbi:MAG: class I tRNA ligase family protein [Candidatus Altiarchaeota archaeon]|nr:class I tRNA ligase family protein [Candidatus Altiarchaeota archaeon]